MKVEFSKCFVKSYKQATDRIQNDFDKQLSFLLQDIRYPSLHAKKYNESQGVWQARVNRDWRFYFVIEDDIYYLVDIIQHPK